MKIKLSDDDLYLLLRALNCSISFCDPANEKMARLLDLQARLENAYEERDQ